MNTLTCGNRFAATETAIDTIAQRLPGSPREEVVLTRLIYHVHPLLQGYFNTALSEHEMNETTWMTLMVLYGHPEQRMMPSELSAALAFSRTNATRVVDDLVGRQLIERQPCPLDRRRMYIALTADGIAFIKQVIPGQRQHLRELWADFSAEERQLLDTLLRKMISKLEG